MKNNSKSSSKKDRKTHSYLFTTTILIIIITMIIILITLNIIKSTTARKIELEILSIQSEMKDLLKDVTNFNNSISQQKGIIYIKKSKVEKYNNWKEKSHNDIVKIQHSILENRNKKEDMKIKLGRSHERLHNANTVNKDLHNNLFNYSKDYQLTRKRFIDLKGFSHYKAENEMYYSNLMNRKFIFLLEEWTNERFNYKCYDFKRDGNDPQILHLKCNDLYPIITIIETTKGEIIGGYTMKSLNKEGLQIDYSAFIFSLTKEQRFNVTKANYALNTSPKDYINFNKDLYINDKGIGISEFPHSYGSKTDNTLSDLISQSPFEIRQIEVYYSDPLK